MDPLSSFTSPVAVTPCLGPDESSQHMLADLALHSYRLMGLLTSNQATGLHQRSLSQWLSKLSGGRCQ